MNGLRNMYLAALVKTQTSGWRLRDRMRDEKGQTSTEYLVIAGVLAAILIGVLITFKGQIADAFNKLSGNISKGAGGAGQ